MMTGNWKIKLRWVKAHVGVRGNGLADKLTKEAAANKNLKESYKRIPKRVIIKELEDDGVKKCKQNGQTQQKEKLQKTSSRMLRRD